MKNEFECLNLTHIKVMKVLDFEKEVYEFYSNYRSLIKNYGIKHLNEISSHMGDLKILITELCSKEVQSLIDNLQEDLDNNDKEITKEK